MGAASKPVDTHQIITNDDDQFVVWADSRKLPLGWRYVGRGGSQAELSVYLKAMLVETVPVPLRMSRPAGDSRWAD